MSKQKSRLSTGAMIALTAFLTLFMLLMIYMVFYEHDEMWRNYWREDYVHCIRGFFGSIRAAEIAIAAWLLTLWATLRRFRPRPLRQWIPWPVYALAALALIVLMAMEGVSMYRAWLSVQDCLLTNDIVEGSVYWLEESHTYLLTEGIGAAFCLGKLLLRRRKKNA